MYEKKNNKRKPKKKAQLRESAWVWGWESGWVSVWASVWASGWVWGWELALASDSASDSASVARAPAPNNGVSVVVAMSEFFFSWHLKEEQQPRTRASAPDRRQLRKRTTKCRQLRQRRCALAVVSKQRRASAGGRSHRLRARAKCSLKLRLELRSSSRSARTSACTSLSSKPRYTNTRNAQIQHSLACA